MEKCPSCRTELVLEGNEELMVNFWWCVDCEEYYGDEELQAHKDSLQGRMEELAKAVVEVVTTIWEAIKKTVTAVFDAIVQSRNLAIKFWNAVRKIPGYRRMAKQRELLYYESISEGKSNNWRRARGLPLKRGVQNGKER